MTALTAFEHFDHHVLHRLAIGPRWSQNFPKMKPVIDRLVLNGHARRTPAPGAKVPLMLEITISGRQRLAQLERKRDE